ncbi:stealth conserved region 3 domain-containing protein [Rhizobium sp. Root482]|uniref:stealth conserved region 3 domain-containing protein n=1 Tax=Rhizobium sp. Root482 TaxID=1736543 RepID=UPI00138F306D|nr:stealth conserved region 3 domain-containing protein [Rhizobium sp. Root482]
MRLLKENCEDFLRTFCQFCKYVVEVLVQAGSVFTAKRDRRECAACRSLDNSLEDMRIAAFLLREARSHGITIWQLPAQRGLRLGCNQAMGPAFTSLLRRNAAGAGISLKLQTEESSPNIYEFNPEEFENPPSATILRVTAKPHCRRGLQYLPHRGVTLEFVEVRKNEVIIPRSGLGSRIVATDEMEIATVAEVAEIRSQWPFPIDLVYTWVDSTDDIWKSNFEAVAHEIERYRNVTSSTNMARWHSRDELRFSIRSVDMYAPWIRKIFIVTNGQVPMWLVQNERIQIVPHSALYPDPSVLPTFNSNSIETVLHRIEGLAEHFLYLNDDFFFSAPTAPSDFFSIGGSIALFFSSRYYDARPVRSTDRATVAAHKTTGSLLEKKFGISCKQKFLHAPHAMRVGICKEACNEFSEELAISRSHRFRSHSDIAGPYLFQYYAYLTGRGHSADISAGYFDTQWKGIIGKIAARQAKGMKVFCINDSDLSDNLVDSRDQLIWEFLNARFPQPINTEISLLEKRISQYD